MVVIHKYIPFVTVMTAGWTVVGLEPLAVFEAVALLDEVVKESGVFDMADSS